MDQAFHPSEGSLVSWVIGGKHLGFRGGRDAEFLPD
jgi:hypothetical protein